MPHDRVVGAFDVRAGGCEIAWLGRLHHEIADIEIDLALGLNSEPERVFDFAC